MTTASIAAGFLAALLCGLLVGRGLRKFRAGHVLATAISVTIGLIVLRTSWADDLWRFVQPKVAMDWLPLVCLLSPLSILAKRSMLRAVIGLSLAGLIPVRLLWGSIYLPPESWASAIIFCMAAWSAVLAAPMLLSVQQNERKGAWTIGLWVVATVGTTIIVAASGSLTYGAAAGVCGVAILGVLISTSQIANVAAVPLICLIGLTASFAELPLLNAGLLLTMWMSILVADQVTVPRLAVLSRAGAFVVLSVAISLTVARHFKSSEVLADSGPGSAYGSLSNSSPLAVNRNQPAPASSSNNAGETVSQESGNPVDPFDGLNSD